MWPPRIAAVGCMDSSACVGTWHEPIFTADERTKLQASFGLQPAYRKRKHEGLFAQGPLALSCTECGCKIAYARKSKNEITYRYYRCADGRRVHRNKRVPQINARETEILSQLTAATDALQITSTLADAIADALNKTHRDAMQAKAKSAAVYRAEISELEQREDRLLDRFDAGEVDRQTYDRQLRRLREAKAERFEKLRSTDADSQYLATAQAVLETR